MNSVEMNKEEIMEGLANSRKALQDVQTVLGGLVQINSDEIEREDNILVRVADAVEDAFWADVDDREIHFAGGNELSDALRELSEALRRVKREIAYVEECVEAFDDRRIEQIAADVLADNIADAEYFAGQCAAF